MNADDSSPSPIRDEGWIGPGGRKFVAVGVLLIALGVGGYLVGGNAEEIGTSSTRSRRRPGRRRARETTTIEDTTIESGELP